MGQLKEGPVNSDETQLKPKTYQTNVFVVFSGASLIFYLQSYWTNELLCIHALFPHSFVERQYTPLFYVVLVSRFLKVKSLICFTFFKAILTYEALLRSSVAIASCQQPTLTDVSQNWCQMVLKPITSLSHLIISHKGINLHHSHRFRDFASVLCCI